MRIDVVVVDEAFAPVLDAAVRVRVTDPNGDAREMSATPVVGESGRYAAEVAPSRRGVHQVSALVDRGSNALGRAEVAVLVGGADLELTDPRRQDAVLQRVAAASGGRLLDLGDDEDIEDLAALLRARAVGEAAPIVHEMLDSLWGFLLVVGVLSVEWGLRRRWGLR